MTKDTFINSFGEKMTREKPDDGRIRCGDYGILCAHWISQTPKELHQPLIQILLSVASYGDYDEDHHLRRLIEINIPRQNEKLIKARVKSATKHLEQHFERNIDCNIQIGILKDVAMVKSITLEREKQNEKRENQRKVEH